ncbi:MAG: hypothetical protein QHC40_12145 [Sphingobium sp.]|nr:hypothetical protein [Sphingobium sp.]
MPMPLSYGELLAGGRVAGGGGDHRRLDVVQPGRSGSACRSILRRDARRIRPNCWVKMPVSTPLLK